MNNQVVKTILRLVRGIDQAVSDIEKKAEATIDPVQKSAFERFPISFTLLVTFGVAITFLGFERVVLEYAYLDERPLLLLSIGFGVLALTGTLYKKLG